MDLSTFLLARIGEDEAVARAATDGPWLSYAGSSGIEMVSPEDDLIYRRVNDRRASNDAAHIARHDPARVLAECEAKRRIVGEYLDVLRTIPAHVQGDGDEHSTVIAEWCEATTLRALAIPYADHPEFRAEWSL